MELKHIETKLARASTLPILPNLVMQILALTDDMNASARDYERLIMQDAALTAKILRTANSSYFGGNGQIANSAARAHAGRQQYPALHVPDRFPAIRAQFQNPEQSLQSQTILAAQHGRRLRRQNSGVSCPRRPRRRSVRCRAGA